MKKVLDQPVTKIALAVNRNKTLVYAALGGDLADGKRGRKELLAKAQVTLLVRITTAMIKQAAAKKEITLAIRRALRYALGGGSWSLPLDRQLPR